jgi:hypothetical protein
MSSWFNSNSKPFWKSKTIWFNVAVFFLTWLTAHSAILPALGANTQLQVSIISVANLILRYLTTKPITVIPETVK